MRLDHWPVILVWIAAALLCWGVLRLRLHFSDRGVDIPVERSLHVQPTPHGGGIGIVAVVLWVGFDGALTLPLWGAIAVLALLSWIDDWRPLSARLRLLIHLLAALGCSYGLYPAVGGWEICLIVMAMVWATNLYNFMDGADGLAGSMTAVGFAGYAVFFQQSGDSVTAVFCGAIVVASLVFLTFNWAPARIFMGDVGAVPLGFLAAALGIRGILLFDWPLWLPLLLFCAFWLDASLTLGMRLWRGQRIWQAHREHAYQRLVSQGLGHATVALIWGLIMVLSVWGAVVLRETVTQNWVQWGVCLCVWFILTLLWLKNYRSWKKITNESGF